ncbi:UDP-N-acetylmuramoyl-L-alanine--D-glutamate ligase [Neomegalonema sp.]|uniref:UDP-N-acetylmuramoyl-L-alanine--D-glutamate ligase n=1 Tax=Neomegalonema sp. TaxID=2039713 RepID=UPI00262B9017|nr:UDP-N-acetylmuramoyl-L-alanine--D-glutamate ligase [Neomegalonema sp.]MDD2868956.1 UDP-N-acetylmuramoyl-L-alanine--D-glutamate ligase [Neomegalonema sp.]
MIPVTAAAGRRYGVLGLGRSGLVSARAIRAGGGEALCWDDSEAARATAAAEGFTVTDLTKPESWAGVDRLILSPGVPHHWPETHPAVEAALEAGALLDNDFGLFFEEAEAWRLAGDYGPEAEDQAARAAEMGLYDPTPGPKFILITGSNGKSTTSALTAHLLTAMGAPTQLGGNIGRGVLDFDVPPPEGFVVMEISSYQLDSARRLDADLGVWLNISPDHLDRHGGMGGYVAAKRRLFEFGRPLSAVIGVDEPEGRLIANQIRYEAESSAPVLEISSRKALKTNTGWSAFLDGGDLVEWREGAELFRLDVSTLPTLRGRHNGQNLAAAWGICRLLGFEPERIAPHLASYPGLPHRMELVAQIDGVAWVNDSKATNADAAEKALLTYDRIRWIAGGVPKAGGIEPLKPLFGKIAKSYLIGEAAQDFAATLGAHPHEIVRTLEEALRRARAEAQPGETVLLSPACASFDQFKDYEARGAAFRKIVEGLREAAEARGGGAP